MAHGTVNWFQVSTDDPKGAQAFYGGLFNWTFAADPDSGATYQVVTTPGADRPSGGIADTRGESPNVAEFFVLVSDVAAAAKQAEQLGGKVVISPKTTPDGLTFAHLQDPSGNHFGIYTEPTR